MSALIGAIGGAGDAAMQMGLQNQKLFGEQELAAQNQTATAQREQSLARLKQALDIEGANTQRTAMVGRIDAQTGQLADQQIDAKRALIGSNIADPQAWTPEQQAAVDQSLNLDRTALMSDQALRNKAAGMTGDLLPKDILAASTKEEVAGIRATALQAVNDAKNEVWREKIDFMTQKSKDDNSTRMLIAAMHSAAGGGKDGGDTAKVKTAQVYLETVNAERKAAGQEPISFEEAFSIANYAPKGSQEDSIRARVATTLINNDPKLVKDPAALQKAVTSTLAAIKGDGDTTAPVPKPGASAPGKPGATPAPTRPPLSQFLGS